MSDGLLTCPDCARDWVAPHYYGNGECVFVCYNCDLHCSSGEYRTLMVVIDSAE